MKKLHIYMSQQNGLFRREETDIETIVAFYDSAGELIRAAKYVAGYTGSVVSPEPYMYVSEASIDEPVSVRWCVDHAVCDNAACDDPNHDDPGHPCRSGVESAKEFSPEARQRLAKEGKALPDGSYPIENVQDLRNAIQAFGRAKNPAATKRHIIKRARALGATNLLPEGWV